MNPQTKHAPRGGGRRRRQPPLREFERRFLSEKYRGGGGVLEIAMIWKGEVTSIRQFDKGEPITIGSGGAETLKKTKQTTYMLEHEAFGERFELFTPVGDAKSPKWTLNVNGKMDGFVLVDPPVNGSPSTRLPPPRPAPGS